MFNFLLSIFELHGVSLYEIFFGYVILNWAVRFAYSKKYKPYSGEFAGTTAVIVPILDEDEAIFRQAMSSIISSKPNEILVVLNGPRNEVIEGACRDLKVKVDWLPEASKRKAIAHGLTKVKSDIVVLVDSDTFWNETTLVELTKPFANDRVGGVTTSQTIENLDVNIWTRWASWIEEIRNNYSFPAMSSKNMVGCLPGRTIAFRRHLLNDFMPLFLNDEFLGLHLEVSDDRALTNYTLQAGYQTVFQSTSKVSTIAQADLNKLLKQQLRWARGSQYNTVRMLPWMFKNAPLLAFLYISDILIPILILAVVAAWSLRPLLAPKKFSNMWLEPANALNESVHSSILSVGALIAVAIILASLFFLVRYFRILRSDFKQLQFVPVFVLINILVLVPIRLLGFWWMAYPAMWGTRDGQELKHKNASYLKHAPQAVLILVVVGLVALSLGVLA